MTESHHIEMWTNDYRTWGWQCFTCRAEESGFPSMSAAEAAGQQHPPGIQSDASDPARGQS